MLHAGRAKQLEAAQRGVAAVWSSKHYSNDARWALTVMTALMMCLVTALAVAAIALR